MATVAYHRPWRRILAAYQQPELSRALLELFLSAAPLALIWIAAWFAAIFGLWWLALLLTIPAAAFLVRLFMVQHDCSHRAFFKSVAANDWVGRVIGVLTLTPHDHWRHVHAIHHATSSDLDRRGPGAVETLTVDEYRAASPWRRVGYRLYRHPLILFVLGPAFLFLLQQRLPTGLMRSGWRPWASAMTTNGALAVLIAAAFFSGAWGPLLLVHLPTILLAASIGVWLFYVQHQYDGAFWARHDAWDATEAALRGSSHYDLPPVLRWMTANIGVHHVHHVNSRIPFYRLQSVLRDNPELGSMSRLTLANSVRCVDLALWDEAGQRLISFKQFWRNERAATS